MPSSTDGIRGQHRRTARCTKLIEGAVLVLQVIHDTCTREKVSQSTIHFEEDPFADLQGKEVRILGIMHDVFAVCQGLWVDQIGHVQSQRREESISKGDWKGTIGMTGNRQAKILQGPART